MQGESARRARIDVAEFARFVLTGLTATLGNMATVLFFRNFIAYHWALLPGVVTGLAISFFMSKVFAFRSRDWTRSGGEATRFLLVYFIGAVCYWGMSVAFGAIILPKLMTPLKAEILGILMGAGVMTLTSYFGHRFYTYKSPVDTTDYSVDKPGPR